jgi:hypothetical protein
MIAFEVVVDGQRICLAGIGEDGVLTAIIHWISDLPPEEATFLSVSGMESQRGEMLDWQVPPLAIGSEVLVRVTEAAESDPPGKRSAGAGMSRAEQYRRHLRQLAAEMTETERRELVQELIAELQG